MSYQRTGLGALSSGLKLAAANLTSTKATPAMPIPASGGSVGKVVVIGALGVGGYLLYRHFKKKRGSAPPAAP